MNPLVVLELRFPSLCARIAHLCLHAALGAFVRRAERDAPRWNVAHDLAIDPLLRAAGLIVGVDLPSLDLPAGASAEEFYARLPEGTRPEDPWCDLSDPPPPPEAPPAGSFTRQDDGEGEDPGEGERPDQPGGAERPEEGDEGDEGEEEEEPSPLEARARAAMEDAPGRGAGGGGRLRGQDLRGDPGLDRRAGPGDHRAAARTGARCSGSDPSRCSVRTDRSFMRPSRRLSALAGPDGEWPDVVAMPGRRVRPARGGS